LCTIKTIKSIQGGGGLNSTAI